MKTDTEYPHPIVIAYQVIDEQGFMPQENVNFELGMLVPFAFPNVLINGNSSAAVRYLTHLDVLEVTVRLTQGRVKDFLKEGLLEFMNGLHFEFPGVVFTYDSDGKDSDEIELCGSIPCCNPEVVEPQLTWLLTYMQDVHRRVMPAMMCYLTQKPKVTVTTDGWVDEPRPSFYPDECLLMLKTGHFGHA